MIGSRYIAAVLFVLSATGSVFAKNDSLVNQIFKMIYNEQYEQAELVLSNDNYQIDSFYADILKIDLSWWKFVRLENNSNSKQLIELVENFGEADSTCTSGKIKRLIAKSYLIRFELHRYNLIKAALIRADIKRLLGEIRKEEFHYPRNRMELFYLYDTLFVYFENLINPFFSEQKRYLRDDALAALQRFTTADDLIVKTLACYFTGKIYMNIEKEPDKGLQCFRFLSDEFPQNMLFDELLTDCRQKM
ncbi:MAG: hypothetical protein ACOC1D_00190 [Prolixibacteraceae bacterium]